MIPVEETLFQWALEDPLPQEHTSSHWVAYGSRIQYQREGNHLVSVGERVESIYRPHPIWELFQWLDRFSYRKVTAQYRSFPKVWRQARQLIRDLNSRPTFNLFKSAVALSVLCDHWAEYHLSPKQVVLIGDGYGFLGALIRRVVPDVRIVLIDLPKMLVLQCQTQRAADPRVSLGLLFPDGREVSANSGEPQLWFAHPSEIERIPGPVDCAINIASMQEMKEASVTAYFSFLRRRSGPNSRFYCANRVQRKLPGGEVTFIERYPWSKKDQLFLNEICPYLTHFFSPFTFNQGPRRMGIRVPFINYFDGPTIHKLVRLSNEP